MLKIIKISYIHFVCFFQNAFKILTIKFVNLKFLPVKFFISIFFRSEICHLQSSVLSSQERQGRLRIKLAALQEENAARTLELESMQEDLEYHRRRVAEVGLDDAQYGHQKEAKIAALQKEVDQALMHRLPNFGVDKKESVLNDMMALAAPQEDGKKQQEEIFIDTIAIYLFQSIGTNTPVSKATFRIDRNTTVHQVEEKTQERS